MNKTRLQGKVAQLLNARELVINLGHKQGVQTGMRFAVLGPPAEILDPDSGDLLGSVPRLKVRVQTARVEESFSICRTYETRTVGSPSIFDAIVNQPRR